MSEEKIGMYTTEEIYEELANGFLHRSMVDAMYFKIKDLQQRVEQLEKRNKEIYDGFMATTDELCETTKKVEQLEKENEYLKMNNPEQNIEHFRIVNENKRKIDMLRKENHQLENIRKEAITYILAHCEIIRHKKENIDEVGRVNGGDLLNILNKGSESDVKD